VSVSYVSLTASWIIFKFIEKESKELWQKSFSTNWSLDNSELE
jgi:hypothetical protein